MKKIGIITFFKNNNYGANIQAFVLNKYLSDLGNNVLDINYFYKEHKYHSYTYWNIFKNIIKNSSKKVLLIKIIIFILFHKRRYPYIIAFETFRRKYIPQTKNCSDVSCINNYNFDTIIIGSDQVWNTDLTCGLDEVYFGSGLNAENIITYGVSIGEDIFDPQYEEKIKEYSSNLSIISTREKKAQKYLSELFNRNIHLVLDPVFLYEKDFYDNIALKSKIGLKEKYILIYKLSDFPFVYDVAEYLQKKTGYKIVEVSVHKKKINNVTLINNAGPIEFINLIKNAEYVVTNSFHGTALSVILEKEFYSITSKRPGRIDNLLDLAGIKERKVFDLSQIDLSEIDYKKVKNNLDKLKKESKDFLINNI